MKLLTPAERTGSVQANYNAPALKNTLTLTVAFDEPAGAVGLRFQLEQSSDGVEFWPLGGASLDDVRGLDRDGEPLTERTWTFSEQLMRADISNGHAYASVRTHQIKGQAFRNLALCQDQRLTLFTTGPLTYTVDAFFDDRPLPENVLAVVGKD